MKGWETSVSLFLCKVSASRVVSKEKTRFLLGYAEAQPNLDAVRVSASRGQMLNSHPLQTQNYTKKQQTHAIVFQRFETGNQTS